MILYTDRSRVVSLGQLFVVVSLGQSLFLMTQAYLYNFDPLKPHFYIVKLGFTGVYIIFLISAQKKKIVGTR